MVSTRSALKRGSDDVSPSATSSKRARIGSKPSRSLVDLPAEIRHMILAELLLAKDPLDYHSCRKYLPQPDECLPKRTQLLMQTTPPANGMLHPKILRTCKQLCAEGSEILYSNTVNCRVGEPYFHEYEDDPNRFDVRIVGFRVTKDFSMVPSVLRKRMSKVRVQLFAHQQELKSDDSVDGMADGVEILAHTLKSAPAWKDIAIEVFHVYKSGNIQRQPRSASDSARFEFTFKPWRYVRNKASAKITGLHSTLISSLPGLMTSTTPFADLDLAFDALKNYARMITATAACRASQDLGNLVIRINTLMYNVCAPAIGRDDADTFIRGRKRLMTLLNEMVMIHELLVYEHDPESWASETLLSQATSVDETPAHLEGEDWLRLGEEYRYVEHSDAEEYKASDDEGSEDESDVSDPWGEDYGRCECADCINSDDEDN